MEPFRTVVEQEATHVTHVLPRITGFCNVGGEQRSNHLARLAASMTLGGLVGAIDLAVGEDGPVGRFVTRVGERSRIVAGEGPTEVARVLK